MQQCLNTPGVDVNALILAKRRTEAAPSGFGVTVFSRTDAQSAASPYRRSALMAAARAGRRDAKGKEAVRLLVEAKASMLVRDSEGVSVAEFQVCFLTACELSCCCSSMTELPLVISIWSNTPSLCFSRRSHTASTSPCVCSRRLDSSSTTPTRSFAQSIRAMVWLGDGVLMTCARKKIAKKSFEQS